MKNPVSLFFKAFSTWNSLRRFEGVFSVGDASKNLRWILQPGRITEWELRRFIQRELEIKSLPDNVHEITVKRLGLMFYWMGQICGGLGAGVLQEVDPGYPHYYTTFPVRLHPSTVVLDVGTCDGLFAFRAIKQNQAAQVICFEPSSRTADYLRKAAERNQVLSKITIEKSAVGRVSEEVFFTDGDIPEANHVVAEALPGAVKTPQVSLDDYCRDHGLRLKHTDLIKVDAEGADVDVIMGAEQLIREYAPQIGVTTYHNPAHAAELITYLRSIQPRYQLRLKGFFLWGGDWVPRPVLLQAALPEAAG